MTMRNELVSCLRDCANALGELLPADHAHRSSVDRANRLLSLHDERSAEQRAADALRDLTAALPAGTATSMSAFQPDVNGRQAGVVRVLLMADSTDDLRCAQWVITRGAAATPSINGTVTAACDRLLDDVGNMHAQQRKHNTQVVEVRQSVSDFGDDRPIVDFKDLMKASFGAGRGVVTLRQGMSDEEIAQAIRFAETVSGGKAFSVVPAAQD